jgi:pantoate--beta-alanine ligase
MRVIQTPSAMQSWALKTRAAGLRIGFVPTMGFLHEGHMSLIREARRRVGNKGKVIVSIYVNPTQFAPTEDLTKYPRDLKRDLTMCRREGVDLVFTPSDAEMYPGKTEGLFSTYVQEEVLGARMEGSSRPSHFRGVTTIVAKLFLLTQPHVAVFGAKDFQQAAIIQRMVQDLNFPIRIVVAPTFREPDGLAMSSRNVYLNPHERKQAVVLYQALKRARDIVRKKSTPASALKEEIVRLIAEQPLARLDYVSFFNPHTLEELGQVKKGSHMALAVFFGKTRLIDNMRLD